MPITAVTQWSTTAASNTDVNGMLIGNNQMQPGQVDNVVREMMAQIATFNTSATFGDGSFVSTDAGSTFGPVVDFYRNSASPAASDFLAQHIFSGKDSAGNKTTYADMFARLLDPTDGSEDANLTWRVVVAGSLGGGGGSMALNGDGLNISGIKFPATQVASADANVLDDYEEGVFTPTMIGGSTAGTTTYSSQVGHYTKIGRQVFFMVQVTWTAATGTGEMRIGGMPFAQGVTGGAFVVALSSVAYTSFVTGVGLASQTYFRLSQAASDAASAVLNVEAAGTVYVSGSYHI